MRTDNTLAEPGDWVGAAIGVTTHALDELGLSQAVVTKLMNARLIVTHHKQRLLTAYSQEEVDCWELYDLDKSEVCGTIPCDMVAPVTHPGEKGATGGLYRPRT